MDFSNVFLDMSLQIREVKVKNEQMGLHQAKKFFTETKQNKILAKQIAYLKRTFANQISLILFNLILLFFGNCNFGWVLPRVSSIISNSEENILFGDCFRHSRMRDLQKSFVP